MGLQTARTQRLDNALHDSERLIGALKVVQCAQTHVFATYTMSCRGMR